MTLPTHNKALEIFEEVCLETDKLDIEKGKMPQTSRKHFLAVAECAKKIAKNCKNLDPEKAYICGLLHDCGQPSENRDCNKFHGLVGYHKMMEMGFDEVARTCLTHSFPEYDFKPERFSYTHSEMVLCRNLINNISYNDYDLLIQYSDMLCKGGLVTTLKDRIIYIMNTYKISIKDARIRYRIMLKIKKHFDKLCGQDTYCLLGIKND